MSMRWTGCAVAGLLLFAPALAKADPCQAIPDHGPAPAFLQLGARFSGEVVRVLDGDSLCVAVGPTPAQWVEVRVADFYAPELHEPGRPQARAALAQVALGRIAACQAGRQSYDRVVASCRIDGAPIGDLLRQAGAAEGGRGYGTAPGSAPRRVAPTPLMDVSEPAMAQPFRSCAAARAAGAAPLHRGQPGYSPRLDGDHDGVTCESYRPR